MRTFPCLTVNLDAIRQNARVVSDMCAAGGVRVSGVVKFSDCDVRVAEAYYEGGCSEIAVSRAKHLQKLKAAHPEMKTLLTRAPTRGEAELCARYADYSLHSDADVLRALNEKAELFDTHPGVILMLDIGDLREGACSIEELCSLADLCERELKSLRLVGVGTNLACLNGVLPSEENLTFLVKGAEAVEARIGRRLEIVSGGSSINMLMFKDGKNLMPERINHLRIGGFIANPVNMRINRGVSLGGMREDSVKLTAEIIEVRVKDSAPKNTSSRNWAGERVTVTDRGKRKRAILSIGGQDIGSFATLVSDDPGIEIVGGSSDHTIIDLTYSDREWRSGDTVTFGVKYAAMLYAFSGDHVAVEYIRDE